MGYCLLLGLLELRVDVLSYYFSYYFILIVTMEAGYVKADSRNLPDIDHLMIAQFFSRSDLYLSAEIRAVKNQR